jgi:hypothetical protein
VRELLALGLFFLSIYLFVRLAGTLLARLAGSRYRAYRQLAQRYKGRYENRGMVDPPTVSFSYQGSSVRVGLAPTVQGQPSLPRTRVVVRFGRGLPLRLELMPVGRPAPPQPPKGTRPVAVGVSEFDRAYMIRANDPEIAREFLSLEPIRAAIESLKRLSPPSGMLVSVNPERLLVQIDRNLGQQLIFLDAAVKNALALHDALQLSVARRYSEGVEIVAAGPAAGEEAGPAECEVCGDPIAGPHVVCESCRTPFHRDCWTFVGGCSTFGCTSKRCAPA